ncbi:hypothetical protein [uncultured Sphingomonas sp.]|uniref:hypothetical protein n=1 Tax=uncultured Sphingomonas sp. TaxID=158754 RepID=UPI0025DB8C26|nr:hypothetical protein [uncultured Sphingomonas sp.]
MQDAKLQQDMIVLIVEDQPFVGLVAAEMVEMIGGTVTEVAATVEEALQAVERGGFTVAMLDIDLEGQSSEPVARALHAAGYPFLITSGFETCFPGFEDTPRLMKPYVMSQLETKLAGLLG